jgi:hypothetical protein
MTPGRPKILSPRIGQIALSYRVRNLKHTYQNALRRGLDNLLWLWFNGCVNWETGVKPDGFVDITQVLQPAIYALVYEGQIVYIGKSNMPCVRLGQHAVGPLKAIPTPFKKAKVVRGYKMKFDSVWILPCPTVDLHSVERALIEHHTPKYNIRYNKTNLDISFDQLLATIISPNKQPPIARRM